MEKEWFCQTQEKILYVNYLEKIHNWVYNRSVGLWILHWTVTGWYGWDLSKIVKEARLDGANVIKKVAWDQGKWTRQKSWRWQMGRLASGLVHAFYSKILRLLIACEARSCFLVAEEISWWLASGVWMRMLRFLKSVALKRSGSSNLRLEILLCKRHTKQCEIYTLNLGGDFRIGLHISLDE